MWTYFSLWTICNSYYCDSWFTNWICDRPAVWHITFSLCWLLGQTESPPPWPQVLCSCYMTGFSISNGYGAHQAHSLHRQMDWSYLHMNQWVGYTLIDTWLQPVPLKQPSSLFPSSPKVLFPHHNSSLFSLQELPSSPTCTRGTDQFSEQDPAMCWWYYMGWARLGRFFIVFFKLSPYKVHVLPGKKTASSSARSQDKSKEIVPHTRKEECGPSK